jgi:glycosyltransferase involved in cell wall biosynthesis
MRVLHVIPSVSLKDGGPSHALRLMTRELVRAGIQVDVATTDADGNAGRLDVPLDEPLEQDGVRLFYFRRQSRFYKMSWPMGRWLSERLRDYDLVHIHALFSYASNAAAQQAIAREVPYIIRPLGVLNRWGMANRRRLLKRLSLRFIERRILQNAAAIHYTSAAERQEAEEIGINTRAAVIPLGIDTATFDELPAPERFCERFSIAAERRIILFLSRLDQKKGLDLLLPAFAEVRRQHPAALLAIAGDGDAAFVNGLSALAAQLAINEHIVWTGFLGGQDKLAAMAAAAVFALPSYSENFGIALVEALAAGLPCALSNQIGIAPDIESRRAGLVTEGDVASLAAALNRLLTDDTLRAQLSANAKRLARRQYSLEAMTGSLIDLYESVAARQTVSAAC